MSTKLTLPPDCPRAMRNLPRNAAGYPVPFFVESVDGVPDFRIMSATNLRRAVKEHLCWLCGDPLKRERDHRLGTFVAGPMCLVNKNSAEPPCHRDCAAWAARACPFLTNPNKERRHANLPESWQEAPGEAILRNPGVTGLIHCTSWEPYQAEFGQKGILFRMGRITSVDWMCQGRSATKAEVIESVDSGLPTLMAMAAEEGPEAQRALGVMLVGAMTWIGDYGPIEQSPNIHAVFDAAWSG